MGFTQKLILIEVWWFYTNTNINRCDGFTQILILIGVMVLHKY